MQRAKGPGFLEHGDQLGAEGGRTSVAALQSVEAPGEVRVQLLRVDFEMPQNPRAVVVHFFKRFDQEMFDLHVVVGLRQAQSGGSFQG